MEHGTETAGPLARETKLRTGNRGVQKPRKTSRDTPPCERLCRNTAKRKSSRERIVSGECPSLDVAQSDVGDSGVVKVGGIFPKILSFWRCFVSMSEGLEAGDLDHADDLALNELLQEPNAPCNV